MTARLIWRKSSFSGNLACVELARCRNGTAIRDSKETGQILDIPGRGGQQLITFVKA